MMLTREHEKFIGGPTVASRERVHVTISRKAILFLNAKVYSLMGKPPAVYLYFSRQQDQIVVEPATSVQMPASFPVRNMMSGWKVHTSPFCKHFGIKLDGTEKFIRPEVDSNGRLYLNLSETVRISGTSRKGKEYSR